MTKRALLNCWIVALSLWISSLGRKRRRYLWARKSYSFAGTVLHAGVSEGVAWRTLTVIEFIPPKNDLGTLQNFVLLFRGRYRVWRLRVEEVQRFDSQDEAIEFSNFGSR